MSTRERWIVYPLLFMTLGIALRDKVIPPTRLGNRAATLDAREIATELLRCRQLQVETLICDRIESQRLESHSLIVNGPTGRPVIMAGAEAKSGAGTLETFTSKGVPQVRLFSTDTGGMVTTIGHSGKVILVMGHTGAHFGVFAQVPELGPPVPLTVPWRYEPKQLSSPSQKGAVPKKDEQATESDASKNGPSDASKTETPPKKDASNQQ